MNRYTKTITSLLLLLIIIISGCGSSTELHMYSSDASSVSDVASVIGNSTIYKATPYNEKVCVIPKESVGTTEDDKIVAQGVLHVDITDNKMIFAKGIYDKLYPASLTKLATALVCFKYGNMNDNVTVSYNASHLGVPGAKLCFLQEGDVIKFDVLLTSFLVYSGNDAGVALAEHIAGSEKAFADIMNKELNKLGAVTTNYVNSHGLPDDNHYTSVYDVYLVLNELSKYEQFLEITSLPSYTAVFKDSAGREVKKLYENTDKYLTGEEKLPKGVTLLAGKTGTTAAAGNCLAVLSEKKNSHKYITIVMKAYSYDSLYSQMSYLLKKK